MWNEMKSQEQKIGMNEGDLPVAQIHKPHKPVLDRVERLLLVAPGGLLQRLGTQINCLYKQSWNKEK